MKIKVKVQFSLVIEHAQVSRGVKYSVFPILVSRASIFCKSLNCN